MSFLLTMVSKDDPPQSLSNAGGNDAEDSTPVEKMQEPVLESDDTPDPIQNIESVDGAPASGSQQSALAITVQKRRRVTRACDECRRKKIKCDGKQPCTHCTVYSYGMLSTSTLGRNFALLYEYVL